MRRVFLCLVLVGFVFGFATFAGETFKGEAILALGKVLADKIEELGKVVPAKIEVPGTGKVIPVEDTIYLFAKFIALYGKEGKLVGRTPAEVPYLKLKKPEKMIQGALGGKIWWDDIYKLANELCAKFEKDPTIPAQIEVLNDRKKDVVTADVLIYLLARTVRWIKDNNRMPRYASIRPVKPPEGWPPVEKPLVKIEKVPPKPGEIRGIWMWYSTIADMDIGAVMKEVKELGFTDVFLLVKGIRGEIAWDAIGAYGYYKDTTVVEKAVKAAHKYGLRIHAWFVVSKDKSYLKVHPEAAMTGIPLEEDQPFRKAKSTIEFAVDKRFRNYVEYLMKDIIYWYDVDGVHLDYIRYPTGAWGWSEFHIKRAKDLGLDVDFLLKTAIETWGNKGDNKKFIEMYKELRYPDINTWVQLRMDDVRAFVEEIANAVNKAAADIGKKIILSAALMPEGGDTDPDANAFAMVHYGQRYADFGDFCDMILPMTYHLEFGKKAQWIIDVCKGTRDVVPETVKVIMGIQGFDITKEEFLKAIYAARQAGADGYCVFRYGSLTKELKEALKEANGIK